MVICSFCGKSSDFVEWMFAKGFTETKGYIEGTPANVAICNECVDIAVRVGEDFKGALSWK